MRNKYVFVLGVVAPRHARPHKESTERLSAGQRWLPARAISLERRFDMPSVKKIPETHGQCQINASRGSAAVWSCRVHSGPRGVSKHLSALYVTDAVFWDSPVRCGFAGAISKWCTGVILSRMGGNEAFMSTQDSVSPLRCVCV